MTDKRRGGGTAVLATMLSIAMLLLALYVGSIGPAGHVLRYRTWRRTYAPVVWTARVEPFDDMLEWYMVKCGAWIVADDGICKLVLHRGER